MEEMSVVGKKTISKAQGTNQCSTQGKHVYDKDTRGMFPRRIRCRVAKEMISRIGT
jgi:hypothetical protein